MSTSKIAILFFMTIVCITSVLGAVIENFQSYNETDFDFKNETECDCGDNSYGCFLKDGIKFCDCRDKYAQYNETCTECNCGHASLSCRFDMNYVKHCECPDDYVQFYGTCVECDCGGNASSCEFDSSGNKQCTCKDGYVLRQGKCTECDCGEKAVSCFYHWKNRKTCVCQKGYVARNGTCTSSCVRDRDCDDGHVCRPNEEGEYSCQCPPNFGGEDCKTNLMCEKLQPMCRDMGAECLIENSEALCRCPWGQIVGLPSGLCEDLCQPDTCFHGRCEFLTNSKVERNYRCICDKGYTGLRCETKIQEESVSGEFIRFAILVSINIVLFLLISAMFCFLCHSRRKQMV